VITPRPLPDDGQPAYLRVAQDLRAQITSGPVTSGASLPTENDMARGYAVGRDTLRAALAVLRHEGLVSTSRGHRSRIRAQPHREPLPLPHQATAVARMPTLAERRHLAIAEGIPVLDIGGQVLPADRYYLIAHRGAQ